MQLRSYAARSAMSRRLDAGHSARAFAPPRYGIDFVDGAIGRGAIPGGLRARLEALSGIDLSDVRVHANSSRPAQLQAAAFAQGSGAAGAAGLSSLAPVSRPAFPVVQLGRDQRPEATTKVIADLGTEGGMRLYYTQNEDGGEHHVEGWVDRKRVGIVDIVTNKEDTELHTSSDEQGGRGSVLVAYAVGIIGKYHSKGDGVIVLPMGGGAVVKLICSKLSQAFGDPDLHHEALLAQAERKKTEKKGTTYDPNRFDPRFLKEHMLHMRSIMKTQSKTGIGLPQGLGPFDLTDEQVLGMGQDLRKENKDNKDKEQSQQKEVGEFPTYHYMLLQGVSKLTISIPKALLRSKPNIFQ